MSSPGDTISQLSTSTPLTAGSTWTSQAIVAGQYNSLTTMIKTDQDGTFYIDWSGDNGLNYDATDTYQVIATVTLRAQVTTQQKVLRMRFTNSSGVNQTYLRLYTYGVVTNNNVLATLVPNIPGHLISVNVANLPLTGYQDMNSATLTPIRQYDFTSVNPGIGQAVNGNPLISVYPDLYMYSTTADPTVVNDANSMLELNSGHTGGTGQTGANSYILGSPATFRAGEAADVRFSGAFSYSDGPNGSVTVLGAGYLSPSPPYSIIDFMGFGFFQPITNDVDSYDTFGILIVSKSTSTFIPRTAWNVDKADGDTVLPVLDFLHVQGYKVVLNPEGYKWLQFSILNPATGLYSLVHVSNGMKPQAQTGTCWTTNLYPIVNLNLSSSGAVTNNPSLFIKSIAIMSQGDRVPYLPNRFNQLFSGSGVTSEEVVVSYMIYTSAAATAGQTCQIAKITATNYNGSDPLVVTLYGRGLTTGGSFVDVNTNLYFVQRNTGATFVDGIALHRFAVAPGTTYEYTIPAETALIIQRYETMLSVSSNATCSYIMSVDLCTM